MSSKLTALALLGSLAAGSPAAEAPRTLLRAALEQACHGDWEGADALAASLDGRALGSEDVERRGRRLGRRHRIALPDGAELLVERITPGGELRRIAVEYRRPGEPPAPELWVGADGACRVLGVRRIRYIAGSPVTLESLDADLETLLASEPISPEVPAGSDPGGVRVAVADSGVDYRQAFISNRLARTPSGDLVGHDFWDLDARPFDTNPARSPFFPQRHGTRTAHLVLAEAPVASLVPYRYPRPDMRRMEDLVGHAARHGVRLVNLSLGSRDREEWRAFEGAARAHPEILFVASAGNRGVDLDRHPVYPAALELDNLITVTSSEDDGSRARGSSFGVRTVDVAVPGEGLVVEGFGGEPRVVSGSSYAAARLSALAACLLSAHPDWDVPTWRSALLDRTRPVPDTPYVARGYIPDPVAELRGACPPEPREARVVSRVVWDEAVLYPDGSPPPDATHEMRPGIVMLEGSGWDEQRAQTAVAAAARILGRCGVRWTSATGLVVAAPRVQGYLRDDLSEALARDVDPARPGVFFVRDSLRQPAFEAEAFGRTNARGRPTLAGSVWLTRRLQHPGVGLAHELVHVLTDRGVHDPDPGNLMHERTAPGATRLTEGQCMQIRRVGAAFGYLTALQ